ncbi:MAG: glycosyltransferase [Ilumatobacter sp.]|uniref:glycosyltransferase family 2 protein n=1 Tax=Ilumatobacter sp. TaxID=1967498 RepID=UPI00260CCCA9|nr:glycosyltransferase [Ilumatobacter sp.]MDJ0768338.1 glycosyltransferase [Ilumatobacter sp.]
MSPRCSVLTTVFETDREHLVACLRSVRQQDLADWEHVVVDDASTAPWVATVLDEAAAADERVRVIRRPSNGGIAAASSDALSAATGDVVLLLDHDDVLEPDAVRIMTEAIEAGADVAYSDHDLIRPDGKYATPSYKPDFSPERLRNQNYIAHCVAMRRSLADEAGGFRSGFDGAQDHDLLLRVTERAGVSVTHVPEVLYHWRQSPRSVTTSGDNKRWAFEAGVRAVSDHCARVGIDADAELTEHDGCYRLRRRPRSRPLVSVVVPTRGTVGRVWGASRSFVVDAVASLLAHSTYDQLEIVVVFDADTPDAVLHALRRIAGERLVLVPFDGPFNFSEKINLGVLHATGEALLLLNDDTELIEPTSLETMVAHLDVPDVAMVGAKLLFADGTLQHGGHVYHRDIGHACFGWGGDSPGPWPLRPLAVERECSGVTAAAALVRRSAFDEVGGFSLELPLNYNDVDFSLKLRAAGHRIVWTPWAVWYHFESRTRHSVLQPEEYQFVNQRWHDEIHHDPYYNPNLAPGRDDWLERPLRSGAAAFEGRPNIVRRLLGRHRA